MEEKQMIEFFASKQYLLDLKVELEDKMAKHRDDILTVLDKQTIILRRLDEERVFGSARVDKLEKRVEKTEKDVKEVKLKLAIV
ncbi:MAG: hypothetical protein AAB849_00400 [Patescibacteria group bacterium]